VNTVTKANAVLVKMYGRNSGNHKSAQDVVTLSIIWYRDRSGRGR